MALSGGSSFTWGPGAGAGFVVTREDLSDMVTIITPWQTPFYNACPKTRATSTLHEWVTDTMNPASTAGALEGDSFSSATLIQRVRRQNFTQIFRKDIEVTNTMQELDPVGVSNEYNWQVQKALKEIVKNVESRAFETLTSVSGTAGTTGSARLFGTLEGFITQNTADGGQAAASSTVINETTFNNALELIYTAGGEPETAYVSPGVKRDISAFAGPIVGAAIPTNTRNINASEKKLIQSVDVYDCDYGLIQIVMSRWIPQSTTTTTTTGRIWFIERSKVRFAILRPMRHYPIASVGDSTRGMVLTELTLEVLAGDANGVIKRVST